METKDIYKGFTEKFGAEKQIIKAIEELSELQKALCKYLIDYQLNTYTDCYYNVLEEMADVSIMTDQLKEIFENLLPGSQNQIEKIKQEKLQRMIRILID